MANGADEKAAPNTQAQIEFHNAREAAWEEEKTWPIWRITILGDPVAYVPRNDERYWQLEDPNDQNSAWVPKAAEDLPDDAELVDGQVVRTAYAVTTCHARSEDHAKMLALRDNPEYHTVESVEQISDANAS